MPFPDASRVIYQKNPLEEVICQLRFPPILKIETDSPAAFQERIRAKFPFYKNKPTVKLPSGIPAEIARLVAQEIPLAANKSAHEFTSKDQHWSLSLTREFIALTCRKYERWEVFKEWLAEPLNAVLEIYKPAFFTRIGLRYRDVIRRSDLELNDQPWSNLLHPWIAGPFSVEAVADEIEHSSSELVIWLSESPGRVRVIHGIVREESSSEECYLIDADLFQDAEQTEATNVLNRLDYFNTQARLLFRWCIQDKLHNALDPKPISGD